MRDPTRNLSLLWKFSIAFCAIVVIAGTASVAVYSRVRAIEEASRATAHMSAVLTTTSDMLMAVVDQESGLRGFLNSGDASFLDPYHAGAGRYAAAFKKASLLVADMPALEQRFGELDDVVQKWTAEFSEPTIALVRDPQSRAQAMASAAQGDGRSRMDRIRTIATELRAWQQADMQQRRAIREEAFAEARTASIVGGLLSIMAAIAGALWLARSIASPTVAMAAQMRRLAGGDFGLELPTVDRRDEIGIMAGALAEFRSALAERHWLAEAERAHRAQLQAAQAELVEAQKLAALGQLVAGIAHEINTPIGSSLTVATTLDEKRRQFEEALATGPLRRGTLTDFLSSVAKAGRLLNLGLEQAAGLVASFKQVAADRTSAQRRRFDLAQVTEQVLATLRPLHKRSEIEVVMTIPEGVELDSYPGPYGQIITNLVTNALVHAFDGRVSGRIEVRLAGHAADTVIVDVADNGAGIPPNAIGRVFEPFFTTKLGQGGSGLGLHIVHNLVCGILGGRITVTSSLGQGAVFSIRIPLLAPREAGAA